MYNKSALLKMYGKVPTRADSTVAREVTRIRITRKAAGEDKMKNESLMSPEQKNKEKKAREANSSLRAGYNRNVSDAATDTTMSTALKDKIKYDQTYLGDDVRDAKRNLSVVIKKKPTK